MDPQKNPQTPHISFLLGFAWPAAAGFSIVAWYWICLNMYFGVQCLGPGAAQQVRHLELETLPAKSGHIFPITMSGYSE